MADLHEALSTYIEERKLKATLAGFIRQKEEIEEIVVKWFELCTTYQDALSQLQKKFGQVYKDINKKCVKGGSNIDLKYLYERSVASGLAKRKGLGLATQAMHEASKDISADISFRKGSSFTTAASSSNTDASNSAVSETAVSETAVSNSAVSNSAASSNTDASNSAVTPASCTETKCKKYIEDCKEKAKVYGFNLQTDIQQVLGSMGIILLKEDQLDQDLLTYVNAEKLVADIKKSIMKDSVKVDDSIFLDLVRILRCVNKETSRRDLKIQLDNLYKKASEEDGKIIETLTNLCMKLPSFERLETIGELELTTNFLDPLFFPLFNDPLKNKHFIWLNRQDKNSSNLRPDGSMVCIPNKAEVVTLGYCEVKASDSDLNMESAFVDLIRLASLSRNIMIQKENKRAINIQAVGYSAVIYLVEETFPGVTTMTELLSFNIPRTICGLGELIAKLDQLKKISHVFHTECQSSYKHPRPGPDGISKISINPKRRKSKTSSFSLV